MIRLAALSDLPRLLEIYDTARSFMHCAGNPTQWPANYPDQTLLAEDIALHRLFVMEDRGDIYGCFMLAAGPDATYAQIFDGAWCSSTPYGVLHRVASDGSRHGLLTECVAFASQQFAHLRIDTHKDNLPMQRALAREGFIHRGTIITDDGTPRLAYDRIL